MNLKFLITWLIIAGLVGCNEEENPSNSITIRIANPNSIPITLVDGEEGFIDSLDRFDTLQINIMAQPYTFFKAYNHSSTCGKEFAYVNGRDNAVIDAPSFSVCEDGDLYIISILDTTEYSVVKSLLDELYPEYEKINIYQRTADSDQLIDFTKYNAETEEIDRDTIAGIAIDSSTTADYWNKNFQYDRWYEFSDGRIKVVPRSELRCLLQFYDLNVGGTNPGDYDCKYGEIPLFQFSRVGLNTERNQAVVSFFDDVETKRALMERSGTKWQVLATE